MKLIPASGFVLSVLRIVGNGNITIQQVKEMRARFVEFTQCHTQGAIIDWPLLHAVIGSILEIDKLTSKPSPRQLEDLYQELIELLHLYQY